MAEERKGDNSGIFPDDEARELFERLVCTGHIPLKLAYSAGVDPFAKYGDTKKCIKVYNENKPKITQMLKNFNGHISLSAHMLIDPDCVEYLCLSVHFIDENWELKKWIIQYQNAQEHTFLGTLQQTIVDWDIVDKILSVVLKSVFFGDHLDEMVNEVKEQIEKKKAIEVNGQLFRVLCCSELFRVMAVGAFGEISHIIDKVKLLSWTKSEPCWHLTLSKLRDALQMRSMGEFDWVEVDGFYELPSDDEWKKVECICKLVDILYNTSQPLLEAEIVNASVFLSSLQELRVSLTLEASSLDGFGQNVAKKMIEKLDKYWDNMFLVLGVVVVMDPRCKMHFIERLVGKDKMYVLETVSGLYDVYVKKYGSFCDKHQRTDLDRYLEEPVLAGSDDFDLLKWWKVVSSKYPIVARMARDLLAIPFVVPCPDDAYYTEDKTIDLILVSKSETFTNALMCTRSWGLDK